MAALLVGTSLVVIRQLQSARSICTISHDMLQIGGIHKACMLYANDHDGRFPTSEVSAAEAFRKLFPDCLMEEEPFYVEGSAWHDEARGQKPDNQIGNKPDYALCLEKGENHWAYVSGLTTSSASNLPLIADGFVDGEVGRYSDDPTKKGGLNRGKYTSIAYVSGSAKREPLSAAPEFRALRPQFDRKVDMFSREGRLPETARVLNPW